MIKNTYQLKEHSKLLAIDLSNLDIEMLLDRFVGKLDVTASISSQGKYNLESHQYVGVISLSDSKVIIEPKTTIKNLIYMLSSVYNLIGWEKSFVECNTVAEWSDLVAKLFLDLLKQLISKGLNQNYQDTNENSTLIKGQIDFASQFTENFANPIQHNCNYSELSFNTLENQALKLALTNLYELYQQSELSWQISQLQKHLTYINLVNFTSIDFSKFIFSRSNEHYRLPLALAQMILESSSPTFDGRSSLFPAFLIDMNKLFERYVANRLKKYCQETYLDTQQNILIHYQMQGYLDKSSTIKLVPDLVLSKQEKILAVMDTKYKINISNNNDYYQIITYCLTKNTNSGFLVYPTWEGEYKEFYVHNSDIVIRCIGIILDKSVEELNSSIDELVNLVNI